MTLFVYGSLKRGGRHHDLLAGARFGGEACTPPIYALVQIGDYPALVEGGSSQVHGEIYVVDEALLAALDDFEGHPDLYERRRIVLEGGVEAEAYLMPRRMLAQ